MQDLRRVLILLVVLNSLLVLPAAACSPMIREPLKAMSGPQPWRYARILLAEVVAVTAPQRRVELEAWRRETDAVAAQNAEAEARYLAQEAAAAQVQAQAGANDPPLPPRESPIPSPILMVALDVQTQVELFVIETMQGKAQEVALLPAGGMCGSSPQVGHEYLVFVEYSGHVHFQQAEQPGPRQTVDRAFLEAVRACVKGECPDPHAIRR